MTSVLLNAVTTGLPLVPMVLGIYLVFRLRGDFDLTIDASFAFGGAVLSLLLLHKTAPAPAIVIAVLAAGGMGLITAGLHLLLRVPVMLAGLVMSIGFFSVTLRVMTQPDLSLIGTSSILGPAQRAGSETDVELLTIAILAPIVVAVLVLVGLLLRTQIGLALRAAGVNAPMSRSCGVNERAMLALSLCLANALAGLSGALLVEEQRFADVNMGSGMLIAGIGAVLLGDLVVRPTGSKVLRVLAAVLLGTLLYRLILVGALRIGVQATDLEGITALILVGGLAADRYLRPLAAVIGRSSNCHGIGALAPAAAATSDAEDAAAREVARARA